MNVYLLVEGDRTEKIIYRNWISAIFPQLSQVATVEAVQDNHFFLISGHGYPSYLSRIKAALTDILSIHRFDHFFICIDAEEMSLQEKVAEIQAILDDSPFFANTHIIVHDCCIETWFLGHQRMLKTHPLSDDLRAFKKFYDVSLQDPEKMGAPEHYETRAQYHLDYLKAMLREQEVQYSKTLPRCTAEKHYFDSLADRFDNTQHLASFGRLLQIWRRLGGSC